MRGGMTTVPTVAAPLPPEPTPDQRAAHWFLAELRTRISTQPLPYQYAVEAHALEGLWEVFAQAREAMKLHPGCEQFAREVTHVLNLELRPTTDKWHRALEQGRLASRDGSDVFRADLAAVQQRLRALASRLAHMAYGRPLDDEVPPAPISGEQLELCLAALRAGVRADADASGGVPPDAAAAIAASEAAAIGEWRTANGRAADGLDAVGLALSGGGIRSATLCLGVVQVLAARGLLAHVDYLSTVSGGGYTGTFVSTQLAKGTPPADLGAPHGPDPAPIRKLRERAKFLVGRSNWESWGMLLQTVAGMLFNWCGPLCVLALMTAGAIAWKRLQLPPSDWAVVAWPAAGATLLAALAFFALERSRSELAPRAGWVMGCAAAVSVGGLLVWAWDSGFYALLGEGSTAVADGAWTWAELRAVASELASVVPPSGASWLGAGVVVSLLPTALRFLPWLERPRVRQAVVTVALLLAAFVVPLLAVLVCYAFFALGSVDGTGPWWTGLRALAIAVAVAGSIALLLNVNVTGPHRLYRRGLVRSFASGSRHGREAMPLAELGSPHPAPYHLLNATVNLPNSRDARLRERRGDFFLFSREWIGSPVVGYWRTAEWRMDGREPDVGTAMAISGAAVSTHMGLGSIPSLRSILTLLNVRLGYWIRRPNRAGERALPRSPHPGFACVLREMTGLGMTQDRRWLNLSDGGHIENLGVYELLRRRCKFVVAVDGEADPTHGFHGLLTLVRHAQIDLGVAIELDLRDLRPDAATGYCRSHYRLCRVRYPGSDGGVGLLLYLKLSLTGNESELIARYRANNPQFPHQTTLDQFFDEEQFEAYRQLGVHVAEGLFQPALLDGNVQPASVREWFTHLARNLLEPERRNDA
jgi:hypothetical protein